MSCRVVMHIGSRVQFSQTLLDLQEEVRPLRSKGQTNCPDFKHTSVERFFKQHNFYLDWCAFHLVGIHYLCSSFKINEKTTPLFVVRRLLRSQVMPILTPSLLRITKMVFVWGEGIRQSGCTNKGLKQQKQSSLSQIRRCCRETSKMPLTLPCLYISQTTIFHISKCIITKHRDINSYQMNGIENYLIG